jgi:hypothetical protein
MVCRRVLSVLAFFVSISMPLFLACAAETSAESGNPVISQSQPSAQEESDTQWAWGEVLDIDGAEKTVTLRYLDYETDQEKDIVISVDANTSFENIAGFDEIKPKDTLSIDYLPGPDGRNTAKNISFENPDASSAVPEQTLGDAGQPDAQEYAAEPEPAEVISSDEGAALPDEPLEPSGQEKM